MQHILFSIYALFIVYVQCEDDVLHCYNSTNESTPCDKNDKHCFIKIESSQKVVRGCLKDTDYIDCQNNTTTCYMCKENHCNANFICKSCSSDNVEDCTRTINNDKYNKICDKQGCVVKINNNNTVHRACFSEDNSECTSPYCWKCEQDFCNARILCNQCMGRNCSNIPNINNSLKQCLLFTEDDECYTYAENENAMQRGCLSDEKKPNACSNANLNETCLTCHTSNCNNKPYMINPNRKCIKCEGNRINPKCFDEQNAENAKLCNKPLLYYKKESCYTELKNETIKRDCLNDRPSNQSECTSNNNCIPCSEDGCNIQPYMINFTCIQCRSDLNETCINEANKFKGTECRKGVGWTEGCFYGNWNNIIIRGCLIDADETMQYVCRDNSNEQCLLCHGRDCNITPVSAATRFLQFKANVLLNLSTILIISYIIFFNKS